jgi:hypothetical protein
MQTIEVKTVEGREALSSLRLPWCRLFEAVGEPEGIPVVLLNGDLI